MDQNLKEIEVNYYSHIKIEVIFHFNKMINGKFSEDKIFVKYEVFNLFKKLYNQKIDEQKINIKTSSKYIKECNNIFNIFITGKDLMEIERKKEIKSISNSNNFIKEEINFWNNKNTNYDLNDWDDDLNNWDDDLHNWDDLPEFKY